MKTIAAVGLMLLLGAATAGAEDIKGKWAIGAGIFGGGGEVSLIRGKSERSAWLFDLSIANQSTAEVSEPTSSVGVLRNSDQVFMSVGPGYRGFVRITDGLAPYWDISAHFLYNRLHQRDDNNFRTVKSTGGDAALSFGLEYFTPWHFSIAADSDILGFTWTSDERKQGDGVVEFSTTGHTERASFRLSPILYVRGYF